MLFKFKSKVTGDLIMLEANGRRVLEIIGKDANQAGIILATQMPVAMAALNAALVQEERARQEVTEQDSNAAAVDQAVSLKQRVLPFMEMLKKCHAQGVEIVWGV